LEIVSPGLAPLARDLEWLDGLFGAVVAACDAVGVHCYWRDGGMWDMAWGMRLQEYIRRFPGKKLHLTEFGNLSPGATKKQLAVEYAAYYRMLRDRLANVVVSAHAFMLGGTPEWDTPNGEHGALLFDDKMAAEVAMVERYNQDERPAGASIKAIVLHCTDGQRGLTPEEQLSGTLNWFQNPASQCSAHYVIARDGQVVACVPEERRAWHAGIVDKPVRFAWLGVGQNPNDVTLGIELVGYADEEFTTPQYRALMRLLAERTRQYDIPVTAFHILGHYRLYSQRTDPGAQFDWARVFAGIGAWYQRWLREAA
jgi:N-acetyl-anhydromuramyl-L-alanine amidase AmpD